LIARVSAQIVEIPVSILLTILIVIIILVATWVVAKILSILVSRTMGRHDSKLSRQTKRVIVWLTWITGISLALSQLGLGLTLPVIVVVAGIAAIVAFRDVFSDLIAYEVLTTYDQFVIGDWIQVGKYFGRVVDVTWINTVVMTPNNEMVYIPNSMLTKDIVVNRTTQCGVRISVLIQVNKSLPFSDVERILLEVGEELVDDLVTDSKPEVRLMSLGVVSMKVALLLSINNPAKGRLLASEVRKRFKLKLDATRLVPAK
jgi:small conductance mechanosensitive channel